MDKKNIKTKYGNCCIHNGYYMVTSVKEGNRGKYLHRLIYEDKYGGIPEGYQIYHIDGDKLNNNIANLAINHKSCNNTGVYRVSRVKSKKYKSGFCYTYTYTKDSKKKRITSKNLETLKEKVLNKGLEWKNLPT